MHGKKSSMVAVAALFVIFAACLMVPPLAVGQFVLAQREMEKRRSPLV
jgi:hypothetical protein